MNGEFGDRTAEFSALLDEIAATEPKPAVPAARKPAKSVFSMTASAIGRGIHRACEDVADLTSLIQSDKLFDGQTNAVRVKELIGSINKQIVTLNSQVDVLQGEADALKREKGGRKGEAQQAEQAENIAGFLRLRLGETTTQFRDVLKTRSDNLKTQQDAKSRYSGGSAMMVNRSMKSPLYQDSAPLLSSSTQRQLSHFTDDDHADDDGGIELGGGLQATQQIDTYYSMRADAARQIEGMMSQLQGIFTQLAGMVADQGEMLERIDDDVEAAVFHAEKAQGILTRQLEKVSKNKWLIIKVAGILLFFLIIFVAFFF